MEQYVDMLLEKTGHAILRGEIDCNPYKMGAENGCEYCDYQGICGFDVKIPGYEYRACKDGMEREEALSQMEQELAIYHGKNREKGGKTNSELDQGTETGH